VMIHPATKPYCDRMLDQDALQKFSSRHPLVGSIQMVRYDPQRSDADRLLSYAGKFCWKSGNDCWRIYPESAD
jgi:hypothetical protein